MVLGGSQMASQYICQQRVVAAVEGCKWWAGADLVTGENERDGNGDDRRAEGCQTESPGGGAGENSALRRDDGVGRGVKWARGVKRARGGRTNDGWAIDGCGAARSESETKRVGAHLALVHHAGGLRNLERNPVTNPMTPHDRQIASRDCAPGRREYRSPRPNGPRLRRR